MSAAAVSQQVRALEERLATPLFERQVHSVTLTEAGRSYLPVVQQSLLMLETATTGLFGGSREERLYVQSVLIFAQVILARGPNRFEAANPDIALARAPASDAITGALGLVPCLPGFGVPGTEHYHLVYPDEASLRPAARRFRGWLLDYLT